MEQPLKKVLIIDDDPRNIFALKTVLRTRGFECLNAQSAEEGMELITTENNIGIILMDMMMPGMDGYQAMARLRKTTSGEIPVIAVTAQAMRGDREKCLAAGAAGYISKPVDIDLLISAMNEYMK
jgi:two-component system cell cycle response regulator DivK